MNKKKNRDNDLYTNYVAVRFYQSYINNTFYLSNKNRKVLRIIQFTFFFRLDKKRTEEV